MDVQHKLNEIADNTRQKGSGITLTVSGIGSNITTTYEKPIKLDGNRQYELALLNLETYYSFPNIDDMNNKMKFRKDGSSPWKTITIPTGCYEIKAINREIVRQVTTKNVRVMPNLNTLQCVLVISDTYEVDFNMENSLRTVLGFEPKVYKKGRHASENPVNILKVNSVLVHTDIIEGSYNQGRMEPILYTFFPDVSPGEKIMQIQSPPMYHHVTTNNIYRMKTWLTDQDNKEIDLRGETLTVRLHLREC